jgi:hypothetical protein
MVYILTLDMEEIPHEPKKKRGGQPGPKKQKQGQIRKGLTVAESDVNQVYQYWCSVMRPGRKRVPSLDHKRELVVRAAIADYGLEDCMKAIDGCAASDWHMGRNPGNKRYDDLELIFRNQKQVDMFLARVENKRKTGDF